MNEQRAWLRSRRKKRLRILAVMLSACVLFTTYPDIPATLSVFASEEPERSEVRYISGFTALSDEIREQTVPVGTELTKLSLPDTLEAVITEEKQPSEDMEEDGSSDSGQENTKESNDTDAGAETGGQDMQQEDGGKEDSGKGDIGKEETGENHGEGKDGGISGTEDNGGTGETEEGGSSDSGQENTKESNDTDASAGTGDGQDTQWSESGESGKTDASTEAGNEDAANVENDEGSETTQETHVVAMPEYHAENVISVQTLESTSTEEQEETVAISGITWQSEPEYDGNAEGIYIFTAVLPEGYMLAEGVRLPEITVMVESGINTVIQTLLERIAVLPDAEEYLASEPDMDDYGDDGDGYERAYTEWMEGLYDYAGEALAIWEEIEGLAEEEQVQIPQEAADQLAAWVEIANMAQESTQVMAAAGGHTNHTGWTKLLNNTTTLTAGNKYYLEGDIALNSALSISGSGTVDLCLNGHNLTSRYAGEKTWLITVPAGATLNVYDCNGNGKLDAGSKQIGGISVSGTLNVYEGSICGKITSMWFQENLYKSDPMALAYSSAVYACGAGAAVNLYGGSIEGKAATCVYVDSGARLVVEGGNVNSTIDCTTDRNGNVGVQVAAIYVNQGAAAEVKAGRVSATTIGGENLTSGSKNGSIMVMPTGRITISGGTVESVGENCGGIYISEDVYWLENFTVAEGTTYANISGGTINGTVGARGDDIEVTVTGGEITELVSLFGAAKLKMEGSQKIGTASAETEDIAINRLNNGKGYGIVVLTGALTNSVPYLVGTYRTPSSQYPIVFTENFTTYMSGKTPTEYFKSVNGYKVVLLNGEAALMPYVMTFDANGGACETKTGDIGGGNPLRALPEPTRTGYSSDGWYTAKTGGDKITIDAMPSGKDITVYAHWTPVDYAITYDLADGALQDGDSNPASYHIETPDFTLKNPVRAGYVFTGWSGTGLTGEANKTVTVPKGSTGERAYTAHWEEMKYQVTVSTYKDGALWGSGAPEVKLTADNGSSFVTDLTAVGNGSYRIYSGNTDTGVTVTVGGADAAARVDYYTLSFYDRNSELTQNRQTVLKNNTAQKPSAPTRTGYVFAGWCDNANLTGTPVTEISAPITAKQNYYAKWTAAEYKVTFDYQGATGGSTVTDKTVTYDAAYGELPAPTKEGYVFKGWYTSENGQGNLVTAATIVQNASNHTLYAYWKDETAPDQPVLQDGVTLPAGWTNVQDRIPLKLYDGVGVTGLLVSVDGNPYVEVSGFSSGTGSVNYSYTAVQEGEHTYRFKAVDAAGNFAESTVFKVKLDQTLPVIGTLTYENKAANLWQWIIGKTSLIVHIPVTDTGSGVTEISYTMTPRDAVGNLDSSSAATKTASVSGGKARITFDVDFRGTIAINCTDRAGNAADSVTIGTADAGGVIVEDQAPDITVQADRNPSDTQQTQPGGVTVSKEYYDSVPALFVTVKDDTGNAITAGISSVTYQVGDGTAKTVTVDTSALQEEVSFTIPAAEIPTGITEITVAAFDNAGNQTKERVTVKVKGPEKQSAAIIDYREEELTGLVPNGIYSINGTEITADQKGCIPIDGSWFGTTASIVRKGNGNETTDSPAQSLPIPARPVAPTVPELSARTENSITLKTITGAQYCLAEGGQNWQDSTKFEGLNAGTIYSFKAYYPATDTSFASEESSPVQIATIPTAPAPDKLAVSYEKETFTLLDGVEAFTDPSCTTPVTAGSVEVYMGQIIYIRYPANGIILESPTTPVSIPTRPAKPMPGKEDASYPKAMDGMITGLTAGTAYEYRVKDQNGSFGAWQDASLTGTGIGNLSAGEYEVRVKAVETGNVSFRSEAAGITIGEKPATKYETPDIRIDYTAETLTGSAPGAEYLINGKTVTAGADGAIKVEAGWFGTTLSIVRKGNGKDKLDSDAQSLPVPARPQKPTPTGVDVSTAGGTGKLTGLTAGVTYEVSADGGKTWVSQAADGSSQITGLAPGSYVVRVKAGISSFASESSDPAKIGAYQVKVTFIANGEIYQDVFVDYGGTLTDIPVVPPKKDVGDQICTGRWCGDEQGTSAVFTDITADMTVYAVYTTVYTVTLQGGTGYTLTAEAGSVTPVKEGDSFTFRFALADGYQKTGSFAVRVNGANVELTADDTYTISDIRTNQTVTVEGIDKIPDGDSSNLSGGGDDEDDTKPTQPPTATPEPTQPPKSVGVTRLASTPGTVPPATESGTEGREPGAAPESKETPEPEKPEGSETQPASEPSQPQIPDTTAGSLTYPVGEGVVIVTLNNVDETVFTAKVADAIAVAHAVLSVEEFAEAEQGQIIEIRIDVERLEDVPEGDAEVIEGGIEDCQEQIPGLDMGMYVDISMYMRVGSGDWNAIHATNEPVEIILDVPDELAELTADLYIMRAHEGEYLLMEDLDDVPETITIRTEAFSTYAILYQMREDSGKTLAEKCSLCHICPTFLGICCFIWLAMIILLIIFVFIILYKKRKA